MSPGVDAKPRKLEETEGCPEICPMIYMPVCGTDSVTYSNDCELGVAACNQPGIEKKHDGECRKGFFIA